LAPQIFSIVRNFNICKLFHSAFPSPDRKNLEQKRKEKINNQNNVSILQIAINQLKIILLNAKQFSARKIVGF